MLMFSFLQWWYSTGWLTFGNSFLDRLKGSADFFSIGLLLRTLFSPFRQISAYTDDFAPLQKRFQAFFDKLISRMVGLVVRLIILVFGVIVILIEAAIGSVLVLAWPLLPLVPIAAIVLGIMGVTL